MNDNDKLYDLMDDYLSGELIGEDKSLFEDALQQDSEFLNAFRLHKNLTRGINQVGREHFKSSLEEIHQNVIKANQKKHIFRRKVWSIAATLLFLLGIGWWWNTSSTMEEKDLFATYFEPYKVSLIVRDESNPDLLVQAQQAYRLGQYEKAIPFFESYQEKNGANGQLLLAVGICYLQTDEEQQALNLFGQIIKNQDLFFSDQARWYAALTYLKLNQQQKAVAMLAELASNKEADKHREANVLLEQLNK